MNAVRTRVEGLGNVPNITCRAPISEKRRQRAPSDTVWTRCGSRPLRGHLRRSRLRSCGCHAGQRPPASRTDSLCCCLVLRVGELRAIGRGWGTPRARSDCRLASHRAWWSRSLGRQAAHSQGRICPYRICGRRVRTYSGFVARFLGYGLAVSKRARRERVGL